MLLPVEVLITSHNDDGQAVFQPLLGMADGVLISGGKIKSNMIYSTDQFPPKLSNEEDIKSHVEFLRTKKVGITNPGGTLFACIDFAPGLTAPLHRTESIDYAVVLEGEVELTLDSGETRLLKRGTALVQRATNHAWRNTSETEWARLVIITQEAKPPVIHGKVLGHEMGEAQDLLNH